MSYFLKQTKLPKGIFLQIYEGHYDPIKKNASNRCYKKIGYLEKVKSPKIKDPIKYYKNYVDKLNKSLKEEKEKMKFKLIDDSPLKNFGYFLVKTMWNTIQLNDGLNIMNYKSNLNLKIEKIMEALVFSRIVDPCSKLKTYLEVIPLLYERYDFTLDNIYDALEFIGSNYQNFIEILNRYIEEHFKRHTDVSYFDCTNYYFEIDYEKDDKQKGPSKENRPNPIIGQALLLDADGVPMGMKMYPGNENEHPKIREVIKELKYTNSIKGRTVQVADKGLNSSDNIYQTINEADGYIFSQSVKKLVDTEKNWILLNNDYKEVRNKNNEILYKYKSWTDNFVIRITKNNKKVEMLVKQKRVATFNPSLREKQLYEINKLIEKAKAMNAYNAKKIEYGEASKYVLFKDENGKSAKAIINEEKVNEDKRLAGYNLLVTSETQLSSQEIYKIYHNLWRIEESFRILKSQLKSRPVFLQTKEKIYGHFLVCYFSLTLLRLLQIKIFNERFCFNELIKFIRDLQLIKMDNKIANASKSSETITTIANYLNLPINRVFLEEKQVNKFFKISFNLGPLHKKND